MNLKIYTIKNVFLTLLLLSVFSVAKAQLRITAKNNVSNGNLKISSGNNDAGIASADPSNRLSMWTKYQTAPISIAGKVKNQGNLKLDTVVVTVEITDNNMAIVFTGTQTILNIDSGLTANYSIGTYQANAIGLYTAKIYSSLPYIADDDASNDTLYSYFSVTDSIYAQDYADLTGVTNIATFNSTPGSQTIMGQMYELTKSDMLTSISFTLDHPENIGDSLYAVVYSITANGFPDTLIATTTLHLLDSTDVNSITNFNLKMANGPLSLAAGKFFIGVREIKRINIAATNRVFTTYTNFNRNLNYSTIWKRNEEFSEFFTYVLRPEFGCTMAVNATPTIEVCNSANAMIQTVVIGNSGLYSYQWNTGATTDSLVNLAAGTYTVTVTDEAGCVANQTILVTAAPLPVIDSAATTNVKCFGNATGSATISVSNGVAPYTYVWSGATTSTTAVAGNLIAGNYSVLATDSNGCSVIQNYTITEPAALAGVNTVFPDNGTSNGIAFIAMSGGTPPYTYFWSNGATTPSATGLAAATYLIIVTDANNCVYNAAVVVPLAAGIDYLKAGITKAEVFPNPAHNNFNLKLDLQNATPVELNLYAVNGSKVYTAAFEKTNQLNKNISFEAIEKGVYFLEIRTDKGVIQKRIIFN